MKTKQIEHSDNSEFTIYQERIHAALHILGVLFGIFAVPFLILSAFNKDSYSLLGITIYGVCFMMVFTFSTLYHSYTRQKRKRLFKKLDRISIYFLIAGTYTPIIKFYLFDTTGVVMLTILWIMVVLGILFEVHYPDRFPVMSVMFYLFMGLIFLFVPYKFFAPMPERVACLMIAGMLLYLMGVFFYVWQKWKYHHAVWHLFVLAASICHYMALLYTTFYVH